MRVVVVGALGLIGSELVERLAARGNSVLAVDLDSDRHYDEEWKNRAFLIKRNQVEANSIDTAYMDVCSGELAPQELARAWAPDVIVNAGGNSLASDFANLANVRHESIGPLNQTLLHVASLAKARYVFVSSSMVYGDFPRNQVPETARTNPVDVYGALKLGSELLVRAWAYQDLALDYAIVRPSAVYGPLDSNERVLTKMIQTFNRGERFELRDPSEVLDFTPVGLVAELLTRVVEFGSHIRGTFNLSNGRGHSFFEVKSSFSEPDELFTSAQPESNLRDIRRPKRGALSMERYREKFGDFASVPIEAGLRTLVDDSVRHGLVSRNLKSWLNT